MKWRKGGLVFVPDGTLWWARRNATLPTVHLLNDRTIRVYFAGLDENNFGRIGFVDLDSTDPTIIRHIEPEPVLDLGPPGTFDDCGTVPSCVIDVGERLCLYYIGFQRTTRVPYMLFTGLATNSAEAPFRKHAPTPILDRTSTEPFSRSAPCVLHENGHFKMWYWSCTHWSVTSERVHYNNVIRYATSTDGVSWTSHDHVCLTPTSPDEFSIGRPSVIHLADSYRMWYAVRSFSKLYSIGYAESHDGIHWIRKDEEVGIATSRSGWDSEMICYPCVVHLNGRLMMFYNGNGHGATGFGYATLKA